jgi:hypothetical protein
MKLYEHTQRLLLSPNVLIARSKFFLFYFSFSVVLQLTPLVLLIDAPNLITDLSKYERTDSVLLTPKPKLTRTRLHTAYKPSTTWNPTSHVLTKL